MGWVVLLLIVYQLHFLKEMMCSSLIDPFIINPSNQPNHLSIALVWVRRPLNPKGHYAIRPEVFLTKAHMSLLFKPYR